MSRGLFLLALTLTSCGGPPPAPPYSSGSPAFRDEAPSNARVSTDVLPLTFLDHKGAPVDLRMHRGKGPVVLVVTRGLPESPGGSFCPMCVAQVSALAARADDFRTRGASVYIVFPGPANKVDEFIRQAAGGLPFPVLLDRDHRAVGQLGIKGDQARPSTFLVDRDGNVVYAYVGTTTVDRPSVKAVLAELDRLGPKS